VKQLPIFAGLLFAATVLALNARVEAATLQTTGAGSAVATVDRSATFDTLTANNIVHLETYTEGGLKIITSADSWAADFAMAALLDPFDGAGGLDRAFYAISSGNNDWVTIQTTNRATIHGVEFMYGNTWTTGNSQRPWGNPAAVVDWQTWKNDALVSSNTVGPVPLLQLGTVLGFFDPAGFDQLLVRATIAGSGDPTLQAIALDNVQVMLTNRPPAPIIYGSDFVVDQVTHEPGLTVYDTIVGCQYRMVWTDNPTSGTWNPVTPPAVLIMALSPPAG